MKRRRTLLLALAAAIVLSLVAVRVSEVRSRRQEIVRLADLLGLRDGMVVGEIGAGNGWLTVEVARRVAPTGRVHATELSAARLDDIRKAATTAGLNNVDVIEAGERETNLPEQCCDAVFMRRVYHHLGEPSAVLDSLRRALRPGGRLLIIEFRPGSLVGTVTGMGMDEAQLIDQLAAAGFSARAMPWPGWGHYAVICEKTSPQQR